MKPNVYEYLDYRQYILDIVAYLNQQDTSFSFSDFAQSIGSQSPEFLRDIRDRRLNIDQAGIDGLARYLGFDQQQKEYFKSIIDFDHASKNQDKERSLQKILQTREYPEIKQLDQEQYEYFAHWYMPVVRELVTSPGYSGDPQWIAERIVPAVSLPDVKKAIELLIGLNLIQMDESTSRWRSTDRIVSTTPEVRSRAALKYHAEVIGLAQDSIDRFASKERDIRSLTLSMSPCRFEQVKKRMEAFWKELLASASEEEGADQVYQVSMQMFPTSVVKGEPHP
jgi:uncharacterized protein (TIGR02147 family)